MSKTINIKTSKINIFSVLFFFIITPIFTWLQMKFSLSPYVKINASLVILVILTPIIHELLHFVGFIVIGRLKPSQLILNPNKSSVLPYFRTNLPLKRNDYIITMMLPLIILSCFFITFLFISPNLFYSVLIGYSISMSTADLLLVEKLSRLNTKDTVIPLVDVLGYEVLNGPHADS